MLLNKKVLVIGPGHVIIGHADGTQGQLLKFIEYAR